MTPSPDTHEKVKKIRRELAPAPVQVITPLQAGRFWVELARYSLTQKAKAKAAANGEKKYTGTTGEIIPIE